MSEYLLKNLLHNSKLKAISKHIAMVRSVQRDIEKIIPERFRGKCMVMRIDSSTLVLSVRSSIIATQMRLITDELVRMIHKDGSATSRAIKRIKIRMKPATVDLHKTKQAKQLPTEVRHKLAQLASTIQDKKLVASLHLMSQTDDENTKEDS